MQKLKMLVTHEPQVHYKAEILAQVMVVLEHGEYEHSIRDLFGQNFD